ncbi:MAG: terminase family protein [Candidatus Bathyarchaeia archaeon]
MKKLKSELEKLKRELQSLDEAEKDKIEIPSDPMEFCEKILKFKPTYYQQTFLRETSKRVLLCWSRQSGKTTTIAAKAIHLALTNPKTTTLIVAPSLRQSMILSDRIQDFLACLSYKERKTLIAKQQRTQILFTNGSRIIALPNSENLLRGYTAHVVITDEANFFGNDEKIFFDILMPMLGTTNGTLIVSSTPWNKDSVFYRFYNDSTFRKIIVTWEDAVKARLVTQEFINQVKILLPAESFQREYECKFIEDIDAWLPQSLIVKCIDSMLEFYEFQENPSGNFYMGVDFGKHQDYSVAAVVEKQGNIIKVVHVHRFPLNTEYASVIGYIKSLHDRWRRIIAVYCDITGVGDYIVEDMVKSGIINVTGVTFTINSKEEMATILREKMRAGELKIPYSPAKTLQDIDLTIELNIEKYELMKTGHIRFSHPEGTHDDVFWALALAVYASTQFTPLNVSPAVSTGKLVKDYSIPS